MYDSDPYVRLEGITFKNEMLKDHRNLKEISVCMKIKLDYFPMIGDFVRIIRLSNKKGKKLDFRQKIKKLESPEWRKRQFDNYVENTLKRSNSGRLQSSFRKPVLVPGMIFTICDALQFLTRYKMQCNLLSVQKSKKRLQ